MPLVSDTEANSLCKAIEPYFINSGSSALDRMEIIT